MKLMLSTGPAAALLLVLGLHVQVPGSEAFSPASFVGIRSSTRANHDASEIKDRDTHLHMTVDNIEDLAPGTIVTERYLHRFSPSKSTLLSPYSIEERQEYSIADDKTLAPIGDKQLIFRGRVIKEDTVDPDSVGGFLGIGPVLHTIEGLQMESSDWMSKYAMSIFCMKYADFISGKGLEVGSGEGVGGILTVVGAGVVSDSKSGNIHDSVQPPTPNNLSSILMTDIEKESLDNCVDNLAAITFPEPKVELGLLDWNKNVQTGMKNKFDFVLACNCAKNFSPLAKTVAHVLKSSSYDLPDSPPGSFVHLGPQCESTNDLVDTLAEKYRMKTFLKKIVLERIQLASFVADSPDDMEAMKKAEIEDKVGGHVEYKKVDTCEYTAIVGYHTEDFHDPNNAWFYEEEEAEEVDHELSSEYSEEMDDVLGALEALTAGLGQYTLQIALGDERIRSQYEE